MEFKYLCRAKGTRNNGLLKECKFEFVLEEGLYHCPLCAFPMTRVSAGKTVSELLREGEECIRSNPPPPRG